MRYLMKGVILFFISISASALGSHTVYNFFLDTSVQSQWVTIDTPVFPSGPDYNFNNYVTCKAAPEPSGPIRIEWLQEGVYDCTQTSKLNLKSNQSYDLNTIIHVTANNKNLAINLTYQYEPWKEGVYYMQSFLIYIDYQGQLAYRPI